MREDREDRRKLERESELDRHVRMLLWCIRAVHGQGRPITHDEVYQYQRSICGYDRETTDAGLVEISRRGFQWQEIQAHNGVIPVVKIRRWQPGEHLAVNWNTL